VGAHQVATDDCLQLDSSLAHLEELLPEEEPADVRLQQQHLLLHLLVPPLAVVRTPHGLDLADDAPQAAVPARAAFVRQ